MKQVVEFLTLLHENNDKASTDREGFGTGVSQKTCQIDSMSKALVG